MKIDASQAKRAKEAKLMRRMCTTQNDIIGSERCATGTDSARRATSDLHSEFRSIQGDPVRLASLA